MASSRDFLDYILEQLSGLGDVEYRAMMGEYIIYFKGRIVGGIYDDRFLVKPTQSAQAMMPDAEIICNGLDVYNTSQAARDHKKYIPLEKKLLDADGNLIAAIFAGVGRWNSFEIDMIWVDEPYRNQGIGSKLLADTEREAKEHGAYFALAEGLFDWQTGFFKKNGYATVGTLDDCPKGHSMHVLEKRF